MINYSDYHAKSYSSIVELFRCAVAEYRDKTAFLKTDGKISFDQFEREVQGVAIALGKRKNKKFCLKINDPYKFAAAYFAVQLIECVAFLEDAASDNILEDDIAIIKDEDLTHLSSGGKVEQFHYPSSVDCTKVCTILHSSGTTGECKWIMLTHKNLCDNVESGLKKYLMRADDRFLNVIPYSHAFGLVCDLLAPISVGATICIPDSKDKFFSQMRHFEPTVINAPPIIAKTLLDLLNAQKNAQLVTGGKIKKILCGGAKVGADICAGLRNYGINVYGCYGISECSPCVAVNRDLYYKDGSAGVSLDCNVITIADDGEILVRGTNVMAGYYGDNRATDCVIKEGTLYTGDLGYFDDDGFLFVTGRKDNLIVLDDGTKCSPERYEELIVNNTPAKEVLIYSETFNGTQRLCMLVYLDDDSYCEGVRAFVNGIKTMHVFDKIDFTFLPLAKTSTGKIIRKKI